MHPYKNNLEESEVVRNLNSEVKRYDILNYLIEKYQLINYLEIGVFKGENIRLINAPHKDGVDPGVEGYTPTEVNYPVTSDDFFDLIRGREIKYDLIFIDGLHHATQVIKDIENSLNHIVEGGFIVLHDCNPVSFDAQEVPRKTIAWNGDVWKAFVSFRKQCPDMKSCVVDTDFGVGVIQANGISRLQLEDISWNEFYSNKNKLLNLFSFDAFKRSF